MSDPQTNNIGLSVPTRGSNAGQLDVPLNGNSAALDGFIGSAQIISVSSSPITLTGPSGSVAPSGDPASSVPSGLFVLTTEDGRPLVDDRGRVLLASRPPEKWTSDV
jgi:hypothetical protein